MTDWPHGSSDMARRIREHDWAATPLGPIAGWPQSRRTAVDVMLGSGHAMQLAWGPERTVLYNDAYAPMLGTRHPQALGIPFREAWPEIWRDIEPLVNQVFAGETVKFDDMPLTMTRHGYPEQTWWAFSYSPVRDESGAVAGLLNVTVDATPKHRVEQAEAALRKSDEQRLQLLDRQAFLLKLSDALRPLADPVAIKLEATHLLGEHMAVNRCFYADAQLDAWHVTRGFEHGIEPLPDQPFVMAEYGNWIIDEFRAGRPVAVDDMHTDPRFDDAERSAHLALQIEAEVALPLVKAGRLVAMLVVHAASPRAWAGQDLTLLQDVAERTWAAVERARAEALLREREERQAFVLRLSDALRAARDEGAVVHTATRMVMDELQLDRCYIATMNVPEDRSDMVHEEHREGLAPVPQTLRLSDFPDAVGTTLNDTLVLPDVANDPRLSAQDRQALSAMSYGALLAAPVRRGAGNPIWCFAAVSAEARAWTPGDVALLETVAERTWTAAERAHAEAALLMADRRKDEFLAVLAHELRNGLAPLVYNAEIVNRSQGNPAVAKDMAARSSRQLGHLVHLVDDLLDVARITTGKIQLNPELVKPRDVVTLAVDACSAAVDRKRHRLVVIDEADSALTVRGDRVRLTQVVANLLSNATKYTDDGGTITVRVARDGASGLIEVSDTGIGIPPAALPQVFDLFTQVRNQQAYSAGGLGIGLALVRQLVNMQGGSVTAASEGLGRGSRFTVRLPAMDSGAAREPGAAQADAPSHGQPLRVLVVDDLMDAADALAELLRLDGHDAEVAYGGQQALDRVQARRPDLVLLDLGMPGMDGFEVARRLRADFPSAPPLRIVALTGWGQESDRQKTQAASFDGHLAKPPSEAELQAVLAAASQPRG